LDADAGDAVGDFKLSSHRFFLSRVTFHYRNLSQKQKSSLSKVVSTVICPGRAEDFCLAPKY
jgi:hypothetical protein